MPACPSSERMHEVIAEPREEVSEYAPKMYRIQIKQDQIGTIIGPGGKMVRKIQEESGGATIDIQEDGTVYRRRHERSRRPQAPSR